MQQMHAASLRAYSGGAAAAAPLHAYSGGTAAGAGAFSFPGSGSLYGSAAANAAYLNQQHMQHMAQHQYQHQQAHPPPP
jgi:hypothetical protein